MQSVEIDRRQDIGNLWYSDIELGKQFDLSARDAGIDMQLSRGIREILLQHLQGNNPSSSLPVFGYKFARAALLQRGRLIVRVKQDVRIEETTSAHEPRRD